MMIGVENALLPPGSRRIEKAGLMESSRRERFWLTVLQKICGVEGLEKHIAFELPVKLDHTIF